MTKEDKESIANCELIKVENYEYLVLTDAEYFSLSEEEEEKLDKIYKLICKSGYILYYRPKPAR